MRSTIMPPREPSVPAARNLSLVRGYICMLLTVQQFCLTALERIDQSYEVIPGIEILGFEANVSVSMTVYESMLEWKVSSWAYRTQ